MYRYLVYSSVGDRYHFPDYWLDEPEKREFDIWISYYGDRHDHRYQSIVDRYFVSKGSKFQNFWKVYCAHREEIERYEAIFLVDNDIRIGTEGINQLFHIREEYDLWILQPAFPPHSRISHRITARIPGALLHFTNLVECCVPVFHRDALRRFMEEYDPVLTGWGVEYLYAWANGVKPKNRYAVVDAAPCVNPDPPPGANREILHLGSIEDSIRTCEEVLRSKGYRQFKPVTHSVLYSNVVDNTYTDVRPHPFLHDYPTRTRTMVVSESRDQGYECLLSGEEERVKLNDSALAVLGMCNGRTSVCSMMLMLKEAFDMPIEEMDDLRGTIDDVLANFVRMRLVRSYPAPHQAAPLGSSMVQETASVVRLSPVDVPRSVQVINLDRRRDRWLSQSTALEQAGTPNFERLAAVDGRDYDTIDSMLAAFGERLHPDYQATHGFDHQDARFRAKTACALSHREALRRVAASGKEGWHLILEDDNNVIYEWHRLLDNLAATLDGRHRAPDMILLSNRVGIAHPQTGINDVYGADAYAVHSSACQWLADSIEFANRGFHTDYSLDNHFNALCTEGRLDIAILASGPWIDNYGTGYDSDIEMR